VQRPAQLPEPALLVESLRDLDRIGVRLDDRMKRGVQLPYPRQVALGQLAARELPLAQHPLELRQIGFDEWVPAMLVVAQHRRGRRTLRRQTARREERDTRGTQFDERSPRETTSHDASPSPGVGPT
jgi:hypothetical protein